MILSIVSQNKMFLFFVHLLDLTFRFCGLYYVRLSTLVVFSKFEWRSAQTACNSFYSSTIQIFQININYFNIFIWCLTLMSYVLWFFEYDQNSYFPDISPTSLSIFFVLALWYQSCNFLGRFDPKVFFSSPSLDGMELTCSSPSSKSTY